MGIQTTQIEPGIWNVHYKDARLGIIFVAREGFFGTGEMYYQAKTTITVVGHGQQVFGKKFKTFEEAEKFLYTFLRDIATAILEK